ncbi:MAG: hypothetical protein JWL63_1617 [Rhodocyclales bacterium]|nr:hypothetical protein [Rhodocyclales bacterium]
MSQQQTNKAGEQVELQAEEQNSGKERQVDNQKDDPKRVQYGQGFSKDHPSQPGTDNHLASGAGPSGKGTPRSGNKHAG